MDRNMRQNYMNTSGHRSLPHMNGVNGKGRSHVNISRLSPPANSLTNSVSNPDILSASPQTQHEDLISYIYESWNKVTRELDKGNNPDIRYYETNSRQLPANFQPFDLEAWLERRGLINSKRPHHP